MNYNEWIEILSYKAKYAKGTDLIILHAIVEKELKDRGIALSSDGSR